MYNSSAAENIEPDSGLKVHEGKKRKYKPRNKYNFEDESYIYDSAIFKEEKMEYIYNGIAQNILIELEKQNMTVSELSARSTCQVSHIAKVLNQEKHIGLSALIRVAAALNVSPEHLFPFDFNSAKSNGARFDELTRECDLKTVNMILGIVSDIVKDHRRVKCM